MHNYCSEGTINKSQVGKWFKKFKLGGTNLIGEEGRGRPSDTFGRRL